MNESKEERAVVVLTEGKYGIILLDSRNWAVAELNKDVVGMERDTDDFNSKSYTYHANMRKTILGRDKPKEQEKDERCDETT